MILLRIADWTVARQKRIEYIQIQDNYPESESKTLSEQGSIAQSHILDGVILLPKPKVLVRTSEYQVTKRNKIIASFNTAEEAVTRMTEIVANINTQIEVRPELEDQVLPMKKWISSISPGANMYFNKKYMFSPTRRFPRILHKGDSYGSNYRVIEELRTWTKKRGRLVRSHRFRIVDLFGDVLSMPKTHEEVLSTILRFS